MKGIRYAMPQVIAEGLLLDLIERRLHRPDLGEDVDAVAVFLNHACNAAHLALDAAEAGKLRLLDLRVHALNYTPVGYN